MTAGDFVVQLLSGLMSSATLFLVAAGITLIFGAMRIINMAHGSFYMFGAFLMVSVTPRLSEVVGSFWIGLVLSLALVAALGAAVELIVLHWFYAREHLSQLLATVAVSYILADVAQQLWGIRYRSMTAPPLLEGHIDVLGRPFPIYGLFVIGFAVVVGLLLLALLRGTLFGWRVRAAVSDPELLASTGTNVAVLSTMLFAMGASLAGLAGATVVPMQAVTHGMDSSILIASFIVAIVGGLGSVTGAALGALIIGVFQAFCVMLLPQWSSTFIYLAMILLLAFRPTGIMGRPE